MQCTMDLFTSFDPSRWHGSAAVLVQSSRSWTLAMAELPPMKWLIFGCGGVGGYFGARIAQVKGQRVSYIAACQQGLRIAASTLCETNIKNCFLGHISFL